MRTYKTYQKSLLGFQTNADFQAFRYFLNRCELSVKAGYVKGIFQLPALPRRKCDYGDETYYLSRAMIHLPIGCSHTANLKLLFTRSYESFIGKTNRKNYHRYICLPCFEYRVLSWIFEQFDNIHSSIHSFSESSGEPEENREVVLFKILTEKNLLKGIQKHYLVNLLTKEEPAEI